MTIIIAAKTPEGIIACYDTAQCIESYSKEMGSYNEPVKYDHKVKQVGELLVGISGAATQLAFDKFNQMACDNPALVSLVRINMAIREEIDQVFKLLEFYNSHGLSYDMNNMGFNAYVIGLIDSGRPSLFADVNPRQGYRGYYDEGLKEARHWFGIGSGMYPDVELMLYDTLKANLSHLGTKHVLEDAVRLSQTLSKNDKTPIKGIGTVQLTLDGFELLEYSEE